MVYRQAANAMQSGLAANAVQSGLAANATQSGLAANAMQSGFPFPPSWRPLARKRKCRANRISVSSHVDVPLSISFCLIAEALGRPDYRFER
jgi:hypothetical protein